MTALSTGKINFSSCSLKLGSGEVHRHVWIHITGPLVSTSWQYHALEQLRELQLQPELLCSSSPLLPQLPAVSRRTLHWCKWPGAEGDIDLEGSLLPGVVLQLKEVAGCRHEVQVSILQLVCRAGRRMLTLWPLFIRDLTLACPLKCREHLAGLPYGS